MSVEIKQHTASTFLIKMSTSEGFVSKPKIYELDYVLNSQSPEKTLIICKSVETGQYLFKETIENIKVDGASFQDVESLTSELAPLVFSVGGGSGSGASSDTSESENDENENSSFEEKDTYRSITERSSYIPKAVSFLYDGEDPNTNDGSPYGAIGIDPKTWTFHWGYFNPNSTGFFNLQIGDGALQNNTTGENNIAYGHYALNSNTNGSYNVAFGMFSGYKLKEGSRNTFIGHNSGLNVIASNSSLFIGSNAGASVKQGRFAVSDLTNAVPIYKKLLADHEEYYKIAIGYDKAKGTITSGLSNFIGVGSSENGPQRSIGSMVIGSADLNGFGPRNYNNYILSNAIYGVKGTQIINSLIWGNYMMAENSDGIIALHNVKSTIVKFSEALIYGKFEDRFLKINGKLILPPKHSPKLTKDYNEVLVRNSEGDITGKPITELTPTLDKETLLNFIRENKEEVLGILMDGITNPQFRYVYVNGIEGGFYYKKNSGPEIFTEDTEIELSDGDYIELTRTEDGALYNSSHSYNFGNGTIYYDNIEGGLFINFTKI